LCRALGYPDSSSVVYVQPKLDQLEDAGLIVGIGEGRYKLAEKTWSRIRDALGISLTQVSLLGPRSMVVEPGFGPPDKLAKPTDIFVAMPFLEELKAVWEHHIKPVAGRLGLTIKRGDDFFTAHAIMSDIWNAISGVRLVIADCTGRNPNVFYEIGIAHVIGKKVVLITQNPDDIPFDLLPYRHILYKDTRPGMKEFESKLTETLQTVL
jgi:hypothetical protein